jgi:hypothetical protein
VCFLPSDLSFATHRMSMQVDTARYWPQRIEPSRYGPMLQALDSHAALFVKKRARALAYSEDPTGVRSLLLTFFQPVGMPAGSTIANQDLMQMCWMFSSDPFVAMFALAFCMPTSGTHHDSQAGLHAFLRSTLSQCVVHEQSHLLPMHLQIFFALQALGTAIILQHPPETKENLTWRPYDSSAPPQDASVAAQHSQVPARRTSARLRSQAAAVSGHAPSKRRSVPVAREGASSETTRAMPALAPLLIPSPSYADLDVSQENTIQALEPLPMDPGQLAVRLTPNTSRQHSGSVQHAVSLMGWGAQRVAGAWGPHQVARQLALAVAYSQTPLAAATQLGAERSEQQCVLPAAFLSSCQEQLDRVRHTMLHAAFLPLLYSIPTP